MTNYDVLIVGLGPTGATLAGLLGQRNIKVAVFDKLPDLYPLPRAIGLDQEAMRITQELKIADRVAAFVAPYKESIYLGVDNEPIKKLDAVPGVYRYGWCPNYVFNQPAYENEIRKRLGELPSVFLNFPVDVVDSGQTSDYAWVDVKKQGEDQATRYTGRYVIACDGGASEIRSRLGIKLEDLKFDEPWLVVDALVNESKLADLPSTNVQYCNAIRPATYVVLTGNHRRWEIMLKPGDSIAKEFPHEELWPLLTKWISPGDAQLWRAAAYRFHGLIATQWRDQRFILAGDAAHMTPPFLAQGMVSGLRDALNLAWKLERVIKGKSSEQLLNSYETERKPHVRKTILAAMDLGKIICEQDIARAAQRDTELRKAHNGVVQTQYRQHLIPNLEVGIISSGSKSAGEMLPQPTVKNDVFNGLLDDLTTSCFRIITLGKLSEQEKQDYTNYANELGGTLLEFVDGVLMIDGKQFSEETPLIVPWLEELDAVAALIRPDHYIYATTSSHQQMYQELSELISHLR